jgi:hypothetical protein
MFEYKAVRDKKITFQDLIKNLTVDDLARETNAMVDEMLRLISDCTDAEVVFRPVDPAADDPYAREGDKNMPWTLGHVIVHCTASSEESAFLAAELARGVVHHGRSRWEAPWERVTKITQCRHRLEESRRMRLACLQVFPDASHLDNTYIPWEGAKPMNAISRFVSGLLHDWDHLGQITEIIRQAKADNSPGINAGGSGEPPCSHPSC